MILQKSKEIKLSRYPYTDKHLELAKLIAEQQSNNFRENIHKWAVKLANDLAKFND